jgi:ABC-2 type transport system permease protein
VLASVKSEFRKLLSVRSTYVITILGALLIGGLLNFYAQGYRSANDLVSPNIMEGIALMTVTFISILTGIVALLMVTHEYRHNTIMYTLTSSNSRTKTLIAKAFVIAVYAVVVGAAMAVLGPLLTWLGANLAGGTMAPQSIDYWNIAWRCLFYSFGNAMAAVVIAGLIRNQIGAIVTYFVIAGTIEELLTLVLKENSKYLPFRALNEVVNFSAQTGEVVKDAAALSVGENALVFTVYMVIGLLATWIFFLRRDAN